MKKKGKISAWHDDKGYGFISSAQSNERRFVHISAFQTRGRRPAVGDSVRFTPGKDAHGRPCAEQVILSNATTYRLARLLGGLLSHSIAIGFLLLLVGAALTSVIPLPLAALYLGLSVLTFVVYAIDKSAAKRGAQRTPENTLHLLALAGGWPGALVAQRSLRHKSRKQPFRIVFWITVVLNGAALAWMLTPQGAASLSRLVARIS